jgi:membrane protease YdiL (CAAX protease family)
MKMKVIFFLMPIALLLWTRLGIELSVLLFPVRYAWIPAFFFYSFFIILCLLYASKKFNVAVKIRHNSLRPIPPKKYLFWGIIVPALLPLGMFILNIRAVPPIFIIYILLFSLVNPFFEEIFWRGLLHHMPTSSKIKILYSSTLFAFSHYFLWGTYWLADPRKWITTVIATFIMGMLWMWFFDKQKNLLYTIISHFFVDVFNLSVAVFFGLKLVTI